MKNAPIEATGEAMSDPLFDAVNAYKDGMALFKAHAPSDDDAANAFIEESYGPPMRVLDNWTSPAQTKEGATAALEIAIHEFEQHGHNPITEAMMKAALDFLAGQEGSS